MYMAAIVRFFCSVGPSNASVKPWWPDISFEYLSALTQAGIMVRALPIGATYLQFPRTPEWDHWRTLQSVFYEPLAEQYVNVVCCQPGVEMGKKMREGDFFPGAEHSKKHNDVVYEPQTAIEGLWTAGMRNVAITNARPDDPPSRDEVETLKKYDAVLCPYGLDTLVLRSVGVIADHCPPFNLKSDASAIPRILEGYSA